MSIQVIKLGTFLAYTLLNGKEQIKTKYACKFPVCLPTNRRHYLDRHGLDDYIKNS